MTRVPRHRHEVFRSRRYRLQSLDEKPQEYDRQDYGLQNEYRDQADDVFARLRCALPELRHAIAYLHGLDRVIDHLADAIDQ